MFKVCIDIGGTFTDCVVLDEKGILTQYKSPSTPWDFSEGFLNAILEAANIEKLSLEQFISQTELIVHGTTVATNALVTKTGARAAIITTKGFRDTIEMRRALKIETHSMYEAFLPPYEPIIPRNLRFTTEEQTMYTGEILQDVKEEEILSIINKIKQEEVESIAICFINSYANPTNEQKAAEICRNHLDNVFITCSTEILPKMGEYERESTCVINAYLGPVIARYIENLEKKLKNAGFTGQLLIMQSNQYAQSVNAIKAKPAHLMGSGPSAAPAGAVFLGNLINEPNIITADVGGTTFDASQIRDLKVSLTYGQWLDDDRLGLKVVDVNSIGAGGGSIGWINSLGLLEVGPKSAGADPGPACYGHGGTEPTITDAAVILGYIPTDYFWGGKLKLSKKMAEQAISKIANPLSMSIENAAQAMFTTINTNMADEITEITTRKGYDIRDYSLLAIGGGGPLHCAFIAELLGIHNIIIPKFAASFSAWSMFMLDLGRDYLRSYITLFSKANLFEINKVYQEMLVEALNEFEALNVSQKDVIIEKSADIRYKGQFHELELFFPDGEITKEKLEQIEQEFHQRHNELFTFSLPMVPIEFRNLRLIAKVESEKIKIPQLETDNADSSSSLKRSRQCFFNNQFIETSIYDGTKLKSGNVIEGHAIIEESSTTIVIPINFTAKIDKYGNYIIRKVRQ